MMEEDDKQSKFSGETMKEFIKDYFSYITDGSQFAKYFVTKDEQRKQTVVYDLGENGIWIFNNKHGNVRLPDASDGMTIADVLSHNPDYFIHDKTYMSILNPNHEIEYLLPSEYSVRKITERDKLIVDQFLSCINDEDKEQGQVCCEDDLIFGVFNNDMLVSVGSYWYWGNVADIGVITHPDYRGKRLITACVANLVKNTDRITLWRASADNKASTATANKLGFTRIGNIYELVKK